MTRRILVAYATKHGSTAEIATAIGEEIRSAGYDVDVLNARDLAGARALEPYDAVVLGSALYAAHWQRDANRFVRRHVAGLGARPVWLFSSGPLDHSAEFGDIPMTPPVAAEVAPIGARGHRTFGGRLLATTPGIDPAVLRTHRQGDFRDWTAIRAWGRAIAAELGQMAEMPERSDLG